MRWEPIRWRVLDHGCHCGAAICSGRHGVSGRSWVIEIRMDASWVGSSRRDMEDEEIGAKGRG